MDGRLMPLAEADPEAIGRLRGVLFDVDDTVTRDGRIEVAALGALYGLGQAGFLRVAVTGRPIGWAESIAHQWPVDLAVGENGAGYVRVGPEGVHEGYFLSEAERARSRPTLDALLARALREVPEISRSADHGSRRCDLAFDVGEHAQPDEASIARLVELIEGAGLSWLRSSVHLHVMPGPWNKADGALLAIEAALGVRPDPSEWAFIGDSGNDAAAFSSFPFSVGVANVRAHLDGLPIPPRFITTADRGLGFAELAAVMIAAKTKSGDQAPETSSR